MDEVQVSLIGLVEQIAPTDLDAAVVHQVKRLLVDSVGCMIGAIGAPPAVIARTMASRVQGTPAATVLGLQEKSTLEMAAFANTVMVRYLDFNDSLTNVVGPAGHVSDTIPAELAVAEGTSTTGKSILVSIAVGYEVMQALTGVTDVRERGWDYTAFVPTAVALASGKLLGLTGDQLGHAAAIAMTSHIATRQMRVGKLSMWKGCASGEAARNGVFAAMLAREGITGPDEPFNGKDGIMDLVIGEDFSLDFRFPLQRPFAVQRSNFKMFPCDGNTQTQIELMLSLRDRAPVDEIESVHVDTYWLAYSENGMEPEKWDPQNRETADHSTPYVLAAALIDGAVNPATFDEHRLADPKLRAMMNRITVAERKDYTDRFPPEFNNTITIRLRSGEVVEKTMSYAYGNRLNPPSDDAINEKFEGLCRWANQDWTVCKEIREACWNIDQLDDLSGLFASMSRLRAR